MLAGDGKAFCAGADIEWQRAAISLPMEENEADARRLQEMLAAIDDCPVPVLAAVHGAALGGGMALCCVADITIASADTVFGFTEVKLGLIPAVISPFVLPRIGEGPARALFLSGERFGSERALRDRAGLGGGGRPGGARRPGRGPAGRDAVGSGQRRRATPRR